MQFIKTSLILFLSAFLIFSLPGCEEDNSGPSAPDIDFKGGSGYTDEDVTLAAGDSFRVGITATKNANTSSNLTNFKVTRTGIVDATPVDSNFNSNTFNWEQRFVAAGAAGAEVWTFTITDNNGETAEVSFTITTEANSLSAPQAFQWEKCGSDNPDLSQWGLEWTQNTSTVAIIKKDADRLVVLSASQWSSITTKQELKDAVDNGTDVADYRGISVQATANYDDVIATKKGNDYYILHVTSANVDATTPCGTTVTINGEYKN